MKIVKLLGSLLIILVVSACSDGSSSNFGDNGEDKTPPAISNPLPSGTLAAGTTSANMQVTTNENATCKYSASSTDEYSAMTLFTTTGQTSHSTSIDKLQDNTTYTRYVRCNDPSGNTSSTTVIWSVGGEKAPPAISNPLPSGTLAAGTTSVDMKVTTDKNATCGYSASSTDDYPKMTVFTTTGKTAHSTPISGLKDNTSYKQYVRCIDANGNTNTTSTEVSWSVGGEKTPPAISNPLPSGTLAAGTTSVDMKVTTDENATCGYSASSTDDYSKMTAFTTTKEKSHSTTITGLQNNTTYNVYVRCKDANGNTNSTSTTVTWKIAAGTGSATLAWGAPTTDKNGNGLKELSGYKIFHCFSASGACTNYDTEPATTTTLSYTADQLATGTHCFAVKAYNSGGDGDAAPSSNPCKTIP